MGPLHIAFTMDCERIRAESPPGGPDTWELSERAIRGYCERLLRHGYKPTLFLTPECAQRHAGMLSGLAERGVELGLHIHPQSLGDHRYLGYLGEYSAEMQRELVGAAAEMVTDAIGASPVSFRPGNFSANDDTYAVLYDLGFRQGSVSDPGRDCSNFAAVWKGAYSDAHYVDPNDRLALGGLPFLEVPLTTDPSRRQPSGFPYEIRIESGGFERWQEPILRNTMDRMVREETPFRTICVLTHNTFPYDDDLDPRAQTLDAMLAHFRELESCQVEVVPVTLQEAHTRFRA